MLIIASLTKRIVYLGCLWNGKAHDITIFKEELSRFSFKGKRVHLDLGFYGLALEQLGGIFFMPNKKPKGKELSEISKRENKFLSSIRVIVENALAGVKSFFICRTKNRFHYQEKTHEAFNLAVGLHNFKRTFAIY
jgi:hypothetical protein